MRQKSKKYLITTATSEIFIVRTKKLQAIQEFCPECKKEAEMLTLDAAVSVSGFAALEILRLMETSEIHFLETANGFLLICEKSVLNAKAERQ
jgi:hypothetical protein